jgi:NADPH-dependent curcumin reductase
LFDYAARYDEACACLTGWVREGKIRYEEHILDGIEHAPGTVAMLYRGENKGKLLVRLRE